MTTENSVFGLDPVGYAPAQSTTYAGASTQIGAEYQLLAQGFLNENSISGLHSPACEGGNCLIVGGGPGVTTLSIGEEDGNGDYLTRAVVDGVEFLEPPIDTFTSGGDFQFATLAIGEDSGSVATVTPPIGQPIYSARPEFAQPEFAQPEFTSAPQYIAQPQYSAQPDFVVLPESQPFPTDWNLALDDPGYAVQTESAPVYFQPPEPALTYSQGSEVITIPIEIVPAEQAYAPAQPIYIPEPSTFAPAEASSYEYEYGSPAATSSRRFTMEPIVSQPAFEPASTAIGYEFSEPVQAAPVYSQPVQSYAPTSGAIETVPITEPRLKPGLYSTPLPVANTMIEPSDGRITVEYSSPRAKPVEIFTNGSPVPYIRPEPASAPSVDGFGTIDAPLSGAASGDYISVGTYDSYEGSVGSDPSLDSGPPAIVMPEPVIQETAPDIIFVPEASLPSDSDGAEQPAAIAEPATIAEPDPVAQPEPVAEPEIVIAPRLDTETRPEVVAEPALPDEPTEVSNIGFPDVTFDSLIPQIKPASIRTVDPVEQQPIVPASIDATPPADEPLDLANESAFEIDLTPDFDLPLPGSTSNEIGLGRVTTNEAPLLTEDDFRITTLALGEEDGGG